MNHSVWFANWFNRFTEKNQLVHDFDITNTSQNWCRFVHDMFLWNVVRQKCDVMLWPCFIHWKHKEETYDIRLKKWIIWPQKTLKLIMDKFYSPINFQCIKSSLALLNLSFLFHKVNAGTFKFSLFQSTTEELSSLRLLKAMRSLFCSRECS